MSAPQVRRLGVEGFGDLLQFLLAPEEGLEAGEVVGGGSLEDWWAGGRRLGVVVLGLAFVEGEAFEDERGGLLRRLVVEFDEAGIFEEPVDVCMIEPAEHDLRSLRSC